MIEKINLKISKGIRYAAEPVIKAELNNETLNDVDLTGYQIATLLDIDIPVDRLKTILGGKISGIKADYKNHIAQSRKLLTSLLENKSINYMCGKTLHKQIDDYMKKTNGI